MTTEAINKAITDGALKKDIKAMMIELLTSGDEFDTLVSDTMENGMCYDKVEWYPGPPPYYVGTNGGTIRTQ